AAMVEADVVRRAPAAQTAASLAPEAFAHAEKIRREAEDAYQNGDLSGAEILGERALAAYQHALVLARIAFASDTANRARVARRPAGATSSVGKSDELLSEVSAMGGLSPMRDDRGVVVTLRELFAASQLTREGRDRLVALGRVAQSHADFPVQVVVHATGAKQ